MSVYKRCYKLKSTGKPAWCYQFRHRGQRYIESGFPTQKAAKEAERVKKSELRCRMNRPVPREDATFDELIPKFLAHRRIYKAEGTVERENRRSRPLSKFFRNKIVAAINTEDIHGYIAHRKNDDGMANRSLNLELTFLRSFFEFAIEGGYAGHNPAKTVKNFRVVTDEHWIPDFDQLQSFVRAAAKTYSGTVLVPWIWFRAYTGTRPKESVFVEWSDLDFQNERISIRPKPGNGLKNGQFRVIEMHPDLKVTLLEWREVWRETMDHWNKRHRRKEWERHQANGTRMPPPHQWVFYNPCNHDERARSFFKCFYQARDQVGIPNLTSHGLRHFFISHAVMSGVDFLTIAKWVGHSSTKMIEQIYGHLSPGYRQRQMAKVSISSHANSQT